MKTGTNSLKLLEVIVTSLDDALEAAAGGADRLEVVRALEVGGLTPELGLVRELSRRVTIPLRVMLRENGTLSLGGPHELSSMCEKAAAIQEAGVDGLVAGFSLDHEVDVEAMRRIMEAAPGMKITFHRAFEDLSDPAKGIEELKSLGVVDRILTVGGRGTWADRKERLHAWQLLAAPEITIVAGAGIDREVMRDLQEDEAIREIHIGRAARLPQENAGVVSRIQVAQLKGIPA